jgi:hypothetical protein
METQMSHTRPQQASSSSHIFTQLNVTPVTATVDDFEAKIGDKDKILFAQVCKELNIEKHNDDFAALKKMVDDYLIKYLNDKKNYSPGSISPYEVKIGGASGVIVNEYINYKIKQQVTSIASDKDNPLKNESHPDEIIITNIKKIVFYLVSKGTSSDSEFNNEILRSLFKDELPSILYILDHCPFISKNEKGNYNFIPKEIYLRLVAQITFDNLPPVSEKDKALINELMTPSWKK